MHMDTHEHEHASTRTRIQLESCNYVCCIFAGGKGATKNYQLIVDSAINIASFLVY